MDLIVMFKRIRYMNIKKIAFIYIMIYSILFLTIMPQFTYAAGKETKILVLVNNKKLSMAVEPVAKDNILFVPVKEMLTTLGFEVKWDSSNKYFTATKKTKSGNIIKYISFNIGEKKAYVSSNGVQAEFEALPFILQGNIMVPLSFISEALDMDVSWNKNKKIVSINNKDYSLDTKGFILKKDGKTSNRTGMAFLELMDYGADCKYILALGEDKRLYVASKSDLKYRVVSKRNDGYTMGDFHPIYYKNKIYYIDSGISSGNVIKATDGKKETEFSGVNLGMVRVYDRIYFVNTSKFEGTTGIKYIDMNLGKEFTITNTEYSKLLYASKTIILYETYVEGKDNTITEIHLKTVDKNNGQDTIVLSFMNNSIYEEYVSDNATDNNGVYVSLNFLKKVDREYIFSDTSLGMYMFSPLEKSFLKFTDIVSNSIYYSNNRLYLIKDSGIGFIDISSKIYTKLFSKKDILHGNPNNIDYIDKEGNVFFTISQGIGMEHYNKYQYKYVIKENVLEFIRFDPGREDESCNIRVGEIINVDK